MSSIQNNHPRPTLVQPNRRPNKPLPRKTAAAAFVLTLLGVILFGVGLPLYLMTDESDKDHERGLAMLILGALTIIPGSYNGFVLYGAWCRWPGYSYEMVPSYDER